MKEISELIVVILEQQSSRRSWWERDFLKIAYFRNSLESNTVKSNGKSGERKTQNIIREKSKLFNTAYKYDLWKNIRLKYKNRSFSWFKVYY